MTITISSLDMNIIPNLAGATGALMKNPNHGSHKASNYPPANQQKGKEN